MKKCTAPRAHAYKKRRMELSRNKEKRSKQRYQEAYQEPSNLKTLIACGLVRIVPRIFIFQQKLLLAALSLWSKMVIHFVQSTLPIWRTRSDSLENFFNLAHLLCNYVFVSILAAW